MKSIFISSTFKDMHAERDIIQKDVIPELSFFAKSFGSELRFVDLRWGVNTGNLESEEGAKKVLSVCLDEIDNCNPYMIILLGERYGWMPKTNLLKSALSTRKFTLDDFNKSVTALEIEYGALSKFAKKENCLVFFRQSNFFNDMSQEELADFKSENASSLNKLNTLKQKLKQQFGDNIIMYTPVWDAAQKKLTGFEQFSQNMTDKVKGMLQEEFESIMHLPWQEREHLETSVFIENKCRQFALRFELIANYKKEISNPDTRLLIVRGNPGRGKSTLLCELSQQLTKDKINVFTFISGNTSRQMTLTDFYLQANYYIAKLLNEKYTNSNTAELKKDFFNLLNMYTAHTRTSLVLIVDALDQLVHNVDIDDFGWLPTNIPQNITIVVSFLNSFETHLPKSLQNHVYLSQLNALNESEKQSIINGIIDSHKKELADSVKLAINAKKNSDNVLYISLLLQRLMLFDDDDFRQIRQLGDGQEGIDEYMLNIVNKCPDNMHEMAAEILIEAGERINKEQSDIILPLLATSQFGLRATDIEKIVTKQTGSYSSLDFSRLIKYMRPFFTLRDDARVNFTHKIIRQGLVAHYEKKYAFFNGLILNHLQELKTDDTIREKELYYHAFLARNEEVIINCLAFANNFESENAQELSRNVKTFIETDDGKWFCSVIKNCANYKNYADFINFILSHFFNVFSSSRLDLELLSDIATATSAHIYSEIKAHGRREDVENFIKCQHVLSSTYAMRSQINNSDNNYSNAINYARKRIVTARFLNKKYPCDESLLILAKSYSAFASLCLDSYDYEDKGANYTIKALQISEDLFNKNNCIEHVKLYAEIQLLYLSYLNSNIEDEDYINLAKETINIYENIFELENSLDTSITLAKLYIKLLLPLQEYMQNYKEHSNYIYNNAKTFLHLKQYVNLEIKFAGLLEKQNKFDDALISYEKALTILDYLETNFDETITENNVKSVIDSMYEIITMHTNADKIIDKIDKILSMNKSDDLDDKAHPLLEKFYNVTILRKKQKQLFVYIDKLEKRRKFFYDNFATNRTLNNLFDIYSIKLEMLNKFKMSKVAWEFHSATIKETEDLYTKLTDLSAQKKAIPTDDKNNAYGIFTLLTEKENNEVDEKSALENLTNFYYSGYKILLAHEKFTQAKDYYNKYFSLNSKVLEGESFEDNITSITDSYLKGFYDYEQVIKERHSVNSTYKAMRHPEGWHIIFDERFVFLEQKIDALAQSKELDNKRTVHLKKLIIDSYGSLVNEATYLSGVSGLESLVDISLLYWKKTVDLCTSIYEITGNENDFKPVGTGVNPVLIVAANYIFSVKELVKILESLILYCEPIKELAGTKIYCDTVYEIYNEILNIYESEGKDEQKISEFKNYTAMLKGGTIPPLIINV